MTKQYIILLLALITACCGCDDGSSVPDLAAGNPGSTRALINFSGIGAAVAAVPAESAGSTAGLAEHILACSYGEPDRAYFVYRWIRNNIQPDFERSQYYYIDPGTQSPETVFSTRKAVCSGYASLFRHLAALVNLNASEINGYGVMSFYQPGTGYENYRHIWNGIEINGAWYLVDASWATSPSLDGSSDPDFFFLTDPPDFACRHLPYDDEWQLQEPAVDETAFWSNLSSE